MRRKEKERGRRGGEINGKERGEKRRRMEWKRRKEAEEDICAEEVEAEKGRKWGSGGAM